MPKQFEAQTLEDGVFEFSAGMNQGVMPLLLPKNQLANLVNGTVRGTFVTHRPSLQKRTLIFMDTGIQEVMESGLWQKACYYKPDNDTASLVASISGKLYQFQISGNQVRVYLRSTALTEQSSSAPKCWLWQSEKWVNFNDGINNPVFFDGATCTRSTYSTIINFATTITAAFIIPPADGTTTVDVDFTSVASLVIGDLVTFRTGAAVASKYGGQMTVQSIAGLTVTFLNVNAQQVGATVASGRPADWSHIGVQLPPGRMGAYGMGRNWICLVDGKQFVASDLVGGPSGTAALSYRDAVQNVTENIYLAGGGNFTVPGTVGDIKAMKFVATLDSSLGQGPLQVLTSNTVFSCNAPVDRLTWQDITSPILTESLIGSGGTSQESSTLANGDMIFRSDDGLRSLILARQQFNTWGNVPQSREVQPLLDRDNPSLLSYGSSIVFDNRYLQTVQPIQSLQGVYHKGMVVMNFDPVSSLRGKAPSVYDGLWTGIQPLQLVTGEFQEARRAFAFTLNTVENKIELWEIMRDVQAHVDDVDDRITWAFETPVFFGPQVNKGRDLLQLEDGEISIDLMKGTVDFQVYYKSDSYPCWTSWFSWSQCAKEPIATDPNTLNYKPGFIPRAGFGTPSSDPCDEFNNRPMREAYFFQVKVVITGSCRVLGIRLRAHTRPQPQFAKQICSPICS